MNICVRCIFFISVRVLSQAHINLPEVVINLDIMCAGDNSTVMCLHSEAELKVTSCLNRFVI